MFLIKFLVHKWNLESIELLLLLYVFLSEEVNANSFANYGGELDVL